MWSYQRKSFSDSGRVSLAFCLNILDNRSMDLSGETLYPIMGKVCEPHVAHAVPWLGI
jgi:hypothetical protein